MKTTFFVLALGATMTMSSCSGSTAKEGTSENNSECASVRKPLPEAIEENNKANFLSLEKADLEDAIKHFDKALEIDTLYELAYRNKMHFLLELERNDEALKHADLVIKRFSRWPGSYIQKGMVLHWTGHYDEVAEPMKQALAMLEDSLKIEERDSVRCRYLLDRAIAKRFLDMPDYYTQIESERAFLEKQFKNDTTAVNNLYKSLLEDSKDKMVRDMLNIREAAIRGTKGRHI